MFNNVWGRIVYDRITDLFVSSLLMHDADQTENKHCQRPLGSEIYSDLVQETSNGETNAY